MAHKSTAHGTREILIKPISTLLPPFWIWIDQKGNPWWGNDNVMHYSLRSMYYEKHPYFRPNKDGVFFHASPIIEKWLKDHKELPENDIRIIGAKRALDICNKSVQDYEEKQIDKQVNTLTKKNPKKASRLKKIFRHNQKESSVKKIM
jgi:hypothetical protein